jgi:phosphomannomutase
MSAVMAKDGELGAIFKAYDVRGVVPSELDCRRSFAIGAGFARFARLAADASRLAVAHDMRISGVELAGSFIAGAESAGTEVVLIGLASTDLLYYASGVLAAPGAMLTASHNPPEYNGIKFCLSGAKPVGEDSGLAEIRRGAQEVLATLGAELPAPRATLDGRDWLGEFARHVRSFVDLSCLAPLRVVADAANGMGGLIAPAVFEGLPCALEMLYGELDGTFPNHPANPLEWENLEDLRARILESGADLGLAFDGDADRVFLVDELGEPLSGSTTTAIVARAMLEKHPGATVLYNVICSKTVPEVIAENGGVGVRTRVGHSFIKARMAETDAVFAGEHSGHYYFRENFGADSGIIAAVVVLEALSRAKVTLSQLRRPFERYADSGERNSHVGDTTAVVAALARHFAKKGPSVDTLDGLTVDFGDWWCNVRPSNTEPLLRLNVEATDQASCARHVDELETLIRRADRGTLEGAIDLDPFLVSLLVDPEDKGPLWYFAEEATLYNPRLRRRYAVRDGIPVLLVAESENLDAAEAARLEARASAAVVTGTGPDGPATPGRPARG